MINQQLALVRREIWEHRSIWVTPAAVAAVVTLLAIAMVVAIGAFGEAVNADIGKIADMTAPENVRRAALAASLIGNTTVFIFAMWFLTLFYCLDALYTERKDKSILFWRSLPITDAETVVSKLLVVFLAIPLATFAAVVISHLLNLIIVSIWLATEGANPGRMIWGAVPLFDTWGAVLSILIALPIWLAPLLGWFLFVSAWAKRGPLLRAVLPLVVLPILEYIVFKTRVLGELILTRVRVDSIPLFDGIKHASFDEDELRSMLTENLSLISWLDYGAFLSSIEVWGGLIVCGLFASGAVYLRRYRDDT
jgi:ABC-2 type transport system permease protein